MDIERGREREREGGRWKKEEKHIPHNSIKHSQD